MRCINYIECYDNDVRFVGRGADPEIAAYAFTVLRRKLRDARSVYIAGRLRRCRPGRKRQRADAYCEGWVMAIYHKVAALYPRVVPDGTIEQWLAANVPSLVAIDARSAKDSAKASEDRWHGHIAGQAVDLHAGMGNDSAPLAITDGAA
jgi:hypothetical protein